ncbi:MAG: hypothetical protein OXM54_14680, partial [Acidimicrobiaceae bacterium]|nr:hypothetical protein [Acidimicrobiaceae bacterium]
MVVALLASVLVSVSLVVLPAERAEAQTAQTLVANTGQADGGVSALTADIAQAFTTGSSSAGYSLRSVDVEFASVSNTFSSSSLTATIHADSGGSPGSSLGTLTNPSSFPTSTSDQKLTFTSAGIDLAASTTYFLVMDVGSLQNLTQFRLTDSDSEDSGALAGWSIGDSTVRRAWNSTGAWSSNSGSLKVGLGGVAKTSLVSNSGQADGDTGNFEQHDHAQVFTTGGNAGGYTLTGVDFSFPQITDATLAGKLTATIRSDNSGQPGTVVATLAKPSTIAAGTNSFTHSGVALSAFTTYWAVLDVTAIVSPGTNTIRNTASNNEDAGGAAGFTIADSGHYRTWNASGSWTSFNQTRKMTIHGTAAPNFVGNLGQGGRIGGGTVSLDRDVAQAFTTGSNSGGYSLRSVDVRFANIGSTFSASSLTAGVYTSSGGVPGTSLGTLAKPSSFPVSTADQTLTFTSAGTYLAPNTTYFLVIDSSANAANTRIRETSSDSEDSGALAGWSIGDGQLRRAYDSTAAWNTDNQAIKIGLVGVTAETADECATADTDGSYEVPYDWELKPAALDDGDVFRLLFMSSTERSASSTDIADYNSFVQTRAKAGHPAISDGCGDLFKAVASTSTVDATANTDTESSDTAASIWWLNGAKAADDYTDFYDGGWDSYARRNESGASRSIDFVWTGSNADGTKHASDYLGTASSARYGQPESGSNPINQNRNPASSNNYPLYGLSPLFKVEQRPTVSISATSVSAGELSTVTLQVLLSEANSSGADLVIPVRVKSAGTTLSLSEYSFTGDCDGSAAALNGTVTIPDGNLVDIGRIWLCGDDVDEPDETVIVELGDLPDGWIAGDDSEVAITVTDDDATVVSVSASSDVVLTEQDAADTASFTVSLGRRLLAGENLHVPLEWVPNAGSIGIALPSDADPVFSVAVSGTGVAGEDLGEDEFGVRFTGHDTNTVQTATVTLTPTGNGDDDADDESFRAEVFEAGADWANAFTTVDGGGAPHADDNQVSFTFVDDDRVAGAGIVLDHAVLGAVAGGMVSSGVSLAVEPRGPVTVALSQTQGDAGVASVSVSSLVFDRSNWDVPQVVRVDAHAAGSSLVSFAASGGGYGGVSVDQSVIVAGVPAAPSGCWKCVWASAGNSVGQPSSSGYRVGPVPEGESVWFTVHVDQAASVDVEARLWVLDAKGWASFFLPGRYAARTLGVPIPAGRTSVTFSVPTVDDSLHEPGGSVSARIINAQNCAASRCSPYVGYSGAGPEPSVQVADDDPAPPVRVYPHRASLSLSQTSIMEDAGKKNPANARVDVTVELSAPFARTDAAGLSYLVCFGGDARRSRSTAQTGDGDDHTAFDYRVYREETDSHGNTFKAIKSSHCVGGGFKPGQTVNDNISILVIDDNHEDCGEQIRVSLQTSWRMDRLGYQANPSAATLVIHNDETPATPVVTGHTVDPDVTAAVQALAAQTQHGTAHVNRWNRVLVAFGEHDGTGVTGGPMTAAEARQMADVHSSPVWGQVAAELAALETAPPPPPPPTPEVSITGASGGTEGDPVSFTLTASPPPAADLAVTVTAAATGDFGYSALPTSVTIPASGTATVTVATTDDTVDEADGTVTLTVNAGSGYTVGALSSQTADVADDDAPAGYTVDPDVTAEVQALAAQAQHGTAHVNRWNRVLVAFGAHDGTGVTGGPMTAEQARQMADTHSSPVWDQVAAELAALETAAQQTPPPPPPPPTPEVSIAAGSGVTEGGTAAFTLTASPAPAADLDVSVTIAAVGDWGAATGVRTVTIPTSGSVTFTVATVDDTTDEADGTVTATVNTGSGYTVSATQAAAAVAVADDDDPPVVVPVVSVTAGSGVTEGGTASFTVTASPAPSSNLDVSVTITAAGDHGATTGTRTVTVPASGSVTVTVATS